MFYVYVLKSTKKNWFYVGYSADLRQRFAQHKNGQVVSTKGHRPLVLVYYEAYAKAVTARKREIELKTKNQQKEILLGRIDQQNHGEVA